MKHVFIINPRAGKRNQTSRLLALADELRKKHDLDCTCMLTQSPGHGTELSRRIAQRGEEVRLYACGGDGTLSEVANGAAGFPNAAVTAVPTGTGNDFLKNFGGDAAKFADPENLWDGPSFPLDLIDCNGRLCLTIACSGIDARVADDVHKYSKLPLVRGQGGYVTSLLVNFLFRPIGRRWTLRLDGQEIIGNYALVSVCNGRYYGGGFLPVPEARINDGVLDTIIVNSVSRTKFVRFVGAYSKGEYTKFPKEARVVHPKTIHISCEDEEIITCLDGETVRSHEVRLGLSEKKLNFFGPVGCNPNATAR